MDMSKQGVDFNGLGFYLIDKKNKIIEVEHLIDTGDLGIGSSSVYHLVDLLINCFEKLPNWD